MFQRRDFDYWVLHTAITEISKTPCTGHGDTCPHCEAVAALQVVKTVIVPPDAFVEGLETKGHRTNSALRTIYSELDGSPPSA